MNYGITMMYDDAAGILSLVNSRSSNQNEALKPVWCLPCASKTQENNILRHVHKVADHNYLINLSAYQSMAQKLLNMYPT
jgi:hypothetical protein